MMNRSASTNPQSRCKAKPRRQTPPVINQAMPSLSELCARYPQITGVHSACDALPLIPPDRFRELVAAIERDAQLDPIKITKEGVVLDGRHRLGACYVLDIEPKLEIVTDDPWAIALGDVVRRHLTTGQRAAFAAELLQSTAPAAAQRKLANLRNGSVHPERQSSDNRGRAMEIAGNAVGVSRDSVAKFLKLPPALQQAVKDGSQSLNAATKAAGLVSATKRSGTRSPVQPAAESHSGVFTVFESERVLVLRHALSQEEAVIMRLGDGKWRYQLATEVKRYTSRSQRSAVHQASVRLLTSAVSASDSAN